MTDAQFNILIATIAAGLGGLATVIKWSVGVLAKSLDANTKAHLDSVKTMTEVSTKMDFVYKATGRVDEFIREEASGVHDTNPREPRELREATPNRGRYYVRRKSEPGE